MTINALVYNEIHYLNFDSSSIDKFKETLPKHIYATTAYIKEGLRELLEYYAPSVLTIIEGVIECSLPLDLELIYQISKRSHQITLFLSLIHI